MITIYLDENQYKIGKEYKNITDYPLLYEEVIEALINSEDIEFIIRNRQMYEWLKYIGKNNPGRINYIELNIKKMVSEKYRLEIDERYTDEEIEEGKEIIDIGSGYSNFTDAILEKINKVLVVDRFSKDIIADYINMFEPVKIENIINKEVIKKAIDLKVSKWIENSDGENIKLIKYFADNFQEIAYTANRIAINKRYNINVENIKNIDIFNLLSIIIRDELIKDNVADDIVVELNTMLFNVPIDKEISENIIEVINLSAGVAFEKSVILNYLKSDMRVQKKEVIEAFLKKFKITVSEKSDLNRLISPEYPVRPDYKDEDSWLKWIKEEYFPYKRWLDANKKEDKEIKGYSDLFADWYYDNYNSMRYSSEKFIGKFISRVKNTIETEDDKTVIIIVDNLNYYFLKELEGYLEEERVDVVEKYDFFSTIPAVTTYAKNALMNNICDKFTGFYPQKAAESLKEYFNGREVIYTSKIVDMANINNNNKELYFINYLNIDEILHTEDGKSAQSRQTMVNNELKEISKLIKEFLNRFNDKVSVFIVTDHGSYYEAEEKKALGTNFLKGRNKEFTKKERIIEVSDGYLKETKFSFNDIGYVIDKNEFGLDKNFVIAKAENYYKDVKGDRYFHEGLTPDEVCIEFIRIKKVQNIQTLNLVLLNEYVRYNVLQDLTFEIKNYNEIKLHSVSIVILDDFVIGERELYIGDIEKKIKIEVEYKNIKIEKTRSKEEISIAIYAERFGKKDYIGKTKVKIKYKSMQENKSTFFDDFDL